MMLYNPGGLECTFLVKVAVLILHHLWFCGGWKLAAKTERECGSVGGLKHDAFLICTKDGAECPEMVKRPIPMIAGR